MEYYSSGDKEKKWVPLQAYFGVSNITALWQCIVQGFEELERSVIGILKHFPDNRILIDHFLDRAEEAEIDAICDGTDVHVMGIMEHIEPAGIHSGDSSAVLPPFNLSEKVIKSMEEYTVKLAKALDVRGLLNIQFAIKINTLTP